MGHKNTTEDRLLTWLIEVLGKEKLSTYPPVIIDYSRYLISQAEIAFKKDPTYNQQPWNIFPEYKGNPLKFLLDCDPSILDIDKILPPKELIKFLDNQWIGTRFDPKPLYVR